MLGSINKLHFRDQYVDTIYIWGTCTLGTNVLIQYTYGEPAGDHFPDMTHAMGHQSKHITMHLYV